MSQSEQDGVFLQRSGEIATLRMARPHVRNALRETDWLEIGRNVAELGNDTTTRALVIRGEGGAFSAGYDLRTRSAVAQVNRVILDVYRFPKPVIAAVEGACIGAAWALALSADLIVADGTAFFQPPYSARGLVLDGGIGWLLCQHIGRLETGRLHFTGAQYTAEMALARGLLSEIVPAGQTQKRSAELAAQLAKIPPGSFARSKASLRRSNLPLETAMEIEVQDVALNRTDPDVQSMQKEFVASLGKGKGKS